MKYLITLAAALLLMPAVECAAEVDTKTVRVFIFAGQSNMVGSDSKAEDNHRIAFRYRIGGGFKVSTGWEPLGPAGFYDTFGPELSFGQTLLGEVPGAIAIAKFTHSGSQINDWTPQGTNAKDRNLYPQFIDFIRESIQELRTRGQEVELAGVFYHIGENDMAFGPYRSGAARWLHSTVEASRRDLALPTLNWYVSQQRPPDGQGLNAVDVAANLSAIAATDPGFIHVKAFDLPPGEEKLVIPTAGIVRLGALLARSYLENQ